MAWAFVLVVSNQTVFLMLFILVLQLGRIVSHCLSLNLKVFGTSVFGDYWG